MMNYSYFFLVSAFLTSVLSACSSGPTQCGGNCTLDCFEPRRFEDIGYIVIWEARKEGEANLLTAGCDIDSWIGGSITQNKGHASQIQFKAAPGDIITVKLVVLEEHKVIKYCGTAPTKHDKYDTSYWCSDVNRVSQTRLGSYECVVPINANQPADVLSAKLAPDGFWYVTIKVKKAGILNLMYDKECRPSWFNPDVGTIWTGSDLDWYAFTILPKE